MNNDDEILDVIVYQGRTYNVRFSAGLIYFEDLDFHSIISIILFLYFYSFFKVKTFCSD
jgi:hypothetical protein